MINRTIFYVTFIFRKKLVVTPDPTGVIEKMCLDGIFADWTIVSEEGERFPCHRNILAAKSSIMKAMFTTEMREKEEKETKIHHNNQVVEAFVNYFYEGAVPQMVLGANLSSFLALSELYNLLPLKSQAEDLAIKNLNIENVVEMFSLANIYKAKILLEATKVFILEKKKILGQQDLSQIPKGVMEKLFILLSQS